MLQLDLGVFRNHPDGTSFDGVEESWGADEAWLCERQGKAVGEGGNSVAVYGPGLKMSFKYIEAWHHERLFMKPSFSKRLQCIQEASIMGLSPNQPQLRVE